MSKDKTPTITGKVIRVYRHGYTVYGNPIMSIVLEGDEWGVSHRISDNANLVYQINNPEFRDDPHTFALTRAGRISHVIREA
jgi:hypothetical protein